MKRGDLVEVRWPNAKAIQLPPRFHALIVGVAKENLIVMDRGGRTYQPMSFSCHRVTLTPALKELRTEIVAVARSEAGKAAIATSRQPATAVYEKQSIDGRLIRREIPQTIAPGVGHGYADYRLEPWVLTEGMTSNPTETLIRHIDYWGVQMDAARDQLSPALNEAMTLVIDEGLSYGAAAARLGTTPAVLHLRVHRARAALRRAVGTSDDLLARYSARRGEEISRG